MPAVFDAVALDRAIQQSHAALTQPAPPTEDRRIGWPPYAAMLAGNSADLVTTIEALTTGRGREGNPIAGQDLRRIAATKIAGTLALAYIMRQLDDRDHDRLAKWLGYLDGIGTGAVAVHNARVGR